MHKQYMIYDKKNILVNFLVKRAAVLVLEP